jgi:CheY-like chemotaxis protein
LCVRLPFVSPPSFQPTADEESKSAHMVHRPLSLVLVEDNPSVARALQAALEQVGHSVRSFADGPSVLAGVSSLTPDAILIDIGLPGMDGYELAATLKRQPNTTSALLVAITGFKRRDRVAGDAFDYYFNKPVDVDALLAVLEGR